MNILSLLNDISEKNPDKIAFAFRHQKTNEYDEITFRELDRKSSKVAIYLSNNGFIRGSKVFVLVRPSIDFIILIYGMIKLGAVPIFLPNLDLKSLNGRKELRSIVNRAKIDGLIGSRKILLICYLLRIRNLSNIIIPLNKIKSHFLDKKKCFEIYFRL